MEAQQAIEVILMRQCASYLATPVFMLDADGRFLFCNEPAEALLGRRFDPAGEMRLEELLTLLETANGDGSPVAPDTFPLGAACHDRRPASRVLRYRGVDGNWRTAEVTAFPIQGQEGRHLGAVAMFWEMDGR